MAAIITLRAESPVAQVAGIVPRSLLLPGGVEGRQRTVSISPEALAHIRRRRPKWLRFCLTHIPEVLSAPDYIGHRPRKDPRRVEFARLVGRPGRWLLVSVKFLDQKEEAWVSSAHPIEDAYLTRRLHAGTMQ